MSHSILVWAFFSQMLKVGSCLLLKPEYSAVGHLHLKAIRWYYNDKSFYGVFLTLFLFLGDRKNVEMPWLCSCKATTVHFSLGLAESVYPVPRLFVIWSRIQHIQATAFRSRKGEGCHDARELFTWLVTASWRQWNRIWSVTEVTWSWSWVLARGKITHRCGERCIYCMLKEETGPPGTPSFTLVETQILCLETPPKSLHGSQRTFLVEKITHMALCPQLPPL